MADRRSPRTAGRAQRSDAGPAACLRPRRGLVATMVGVVLALVGASASSQRGEADFAAELDRIEGEVQRAEDLSAIKRLQRTYGYFLDKGLWTDLAEYFTDDAVANYPAGVFVGKDSIRSHLYLNVGGVEIGENGLGDGRLYNHMNIQPVVHLNPDGATARGRWRALAMFGRFGAPNATWAEGVYEMTYAKVDGVWKISTLDYHSGFGAPYTTGWVPPESPGRRGPRELPHPPDRPRDMPCEGFPEACIAPFHYDNPGTSDDGHVWPETPAPVRGRGAAAARASALFRRATRLRDELEIENLQRTFGYYFDRGYADHAAALFADAGTIELELRRVYEGRDRIEAFLGTLGPYGGADGLLNDHVQLQVVVTVADDGLTAKSRSRALSMTGELGSHGEWREGIYENTYVRDGGVWKIASLHYYPTFISAYEQGWTLDAQPPATASTGLPPDRPPTETYDIYPSAHIPAYHYDNPVTGRPPVYPTGAGRPGRDAIAAATARVERAAAASDGSGALEPEAAAAEAARLVGRVRDYHELENLEGAYGYYLDKNLWNELADLFAEQGSMELAQRGIYRGRDRVRGFLVNVFGRGSEGPVAGRLGNHLQWQPVIHVSPDGSSARIRSRMMQQLNFGPRASMGASLYENEAVKEEGRWKFSVVHALNTWTAGYEGGWIENPGNFVPGPSEDYPPDGPPTVEFSMFPAVYPIPFHYRHPVTGAVVGEDTHAGVETMRRDSAAPGEPGGMPVDISARLREIGARIDPASTAEIYAPLQTASIADGVRIVRDQAYGAHERNVLDVFAPARAADASSEAAAMPVIVFIHGGGFTRGAKTQPGQPFYDNVMHWVAGNGMVGININYRLAPDAVWPSGVEDLAAVAEWIDENVADYGGDPGRVFFWGHSAGAAHVGDYIAHRTIRGADTGLAGAILTSGFYDLGDEVSVWQAYYGDDVSVYPERSSLAALASASVPLFVNDAELDPEDFRYQAGRLVEARVTAGRPVEYVRLRGHSHISETYAVGTDDTTLSSEVLQFVAVH